MFKKIFITILIIVGLFCTITIYNNYFKYREFSKETREWMLWYDSLPKEDRQAISYFPSELSEAIENGYEYKSYEE